MNVIRWDTRVIFLLGIWTFLVPWFFGGNLIVADQDTNFFWNFWIVGAIVMFVSFYTLRRTKFWEEWIKFGSGLWMIISPWALGYAHQQIFLSNALFIGTTISFLSLIMLPFSNKQQKNIY